MVSEKPRPQASHWLRFVMNVFFLLCDGVNELTYFIIVGFKFWDPVVSYTILLEVARKLSCFWKMVRSSKAGPPWYIQLKPCRLRHSFWDQLILRPVRLTHVHLKPVNLRPHSFGPHSFVTCSIETMWPHSFETSFIWNHIQLIPHSFDTWGMVSIFDFRCILSATVFTMQRESPWIPKWDISGTLKGTQRNFNPTSNVVGTDLKWTWSQINCLKWT